MRRIRIRGIGVVCAAATIGVIGSVGFAWGAGGAASDAYDGIRSGALDAHALVDLYLGHDFDEPSGGIAALRAFDAQSDRLEPNLLRITLAHRPQMFGFRLDLGAGATADGYLRSDPAASAHPQLSRTLSYVEQGFVTAVVPVGPGLALDVGTFGTPIGLEDNETPLNWNYSRALLYTFAEPTYHSGLRLTSVPLEGLAVSAFWVNGWNTRLLDGNGMRTFAAASSWKAAPGLELDLEYMMGPERAPTRLSVPVLRFRNEADVAATYALTERLTLAFTADYGHDQAGGGVFWWGPGGYLRCQLLPWAAGSVRVEQLADPSGFTTGARQRLLEGTLTLEAKATLSDLSVLARLEFRQDQSDARVFPAGESALRARQDTLTLGLVASL